MMKKKKSTLNVLFTLSFVMLLGCKEETPSLDKCMKFADDPDACEAAGCYVRVYVEQTVFVDGKCIAWEPLNCFPFPSGPNDVEVFFCHESDGKIDRIHSGTSGENWDLGPGWWNCTLDMPDGTQRCYPLSETCEAVESQEECNENYCTWASTVEEAIFEGNACVGWTPKNPGCYSYTSVFNNRLMYRDTTEGTQLIRISDLSQKEGVWNDFYDQEKWSYCVWSNESPICTACPQE